MTRTAAVLSLALLAAAEVSAQTASNGSTVLDKTVFDESGGPGFSSADGSIKVGFSFGQPGPIGLNIGAGSEVPAGFIATGGNGLFPSSLGPSVLNVVPPILVQKEGSFLGVPCVSSVTVGFDKVMLDSRLAPAVSVTLVRDRLGQVVNLPQPFLVNNNTTVSPSRVEISSTTGCWATNSYFQVSIATTALDFEGLPLTAPVTFYFLTLADPALDNVVTSLSDFTTRVRVASGTFPAPYYVQFSLRPEAAPISVSPSALSEADRKSAGPVVLTRELVAFNANAQPLATSFGGGQSVLTVPYPDADGDGFVDGFGFSARARKLSFFVLDEAASLWVRLPNSTVDTAAKTVSAPVPHFSAFAMIAPQDLSVSDSYAFPVPFRPNGPSAGAGAGQTGTEAAGITFTQLPAVGTIEVFNVRGELVWHGDITDGSGKLVWNVRNNSGETVASGVYLFVIKSSLDQKVGKLAIIR